MLSRLLALLIGLAILVAALFLSAVIVALIAAVALAAFAFGWWRATFGGRRRAAHGGDIIDLPSREVTTPQRPLRDGAAPDIDKPGASPEDARRGRAPSRDDPR